MLPGEHKPWAKPLARAVIAVSILTAIVGSWYLYDIGELHIPEITGILLLLLTIIPPNVSILRETTGGATKPSAPLKHPHPNTP
jgi:uncharacterized membrane protein YfcA